MLPSNAPLDKPPSNYNEVLYWKITEEPIRLVILSFLPILLAIVIGTVFFLFIRVDEQDGMRILLPQSETKAQ